MEIFCFILRLEEVLGPQVIRLFFGDLPAPLAGIDGAVELVPQAVQVGHLVADALQVVLDGFLKVGWQVGFPLWVAAGFCQLGSFFLGGQLPIFLVHSAAHPCKQF